MSVRAALAALFLTAAPVAAQPPAKDTPKYALLVGCTEYPNHPNLRELWGPANDIKQWHEVLTKGFGFPEANVARLVGWDKDNPATRPTEENIRKAFEHLITKAGPDTQIVIALSGHGLQVPLPPGANPLDPKNFEPDGLDEVFLPADVRKADANGHLPGAITDNQVGEWLDRLREKGAHVFIVFDCCHSGTMTRGGPGNREVSRVADPAALGISPKQIEDSVKAAAKVVDDAKAAGKPVAEPPVVRTRGPGAKGSLVAFYAAQPFEEAPELPLPEGKPIVRENYFGMLSFTLMSTIQNRQTPLTYRELAQVMAGEYRAARGVKGPTPFAEGDLDREVLGYNVWPDRPDILLTKAEGQPLRVNAGELRGVSAGSILAVHPPAGKGDVKTVLGYVKVESTELHRAAVVPVEFEKTPAKADLPDGARCSVAARDFGDLRVKLFLDPKVKHGYEALAKLPGNQGKSVLEMMKLVESATDADWVLRVVGPKEAEDVYALKGLKADTVLLVRAEGRAKTPAEEKALNDLLAATGKPLPRRAFGGYPVPHAGDAKSLEAFAGQIARDLPKLFRWQNVWRVAGGMGGPGGNSDYGIKLEFYKLKDGTDATGGVPFTANVVPKDTWLQMRVKNTGKEAVWVVAVSLGADLEIAFFESLAVQPGGEVKFEPGQIEIKTPGAYGTEGLVLFLFPVAVVNAQPDFKFLNQTPLRVAEGTRGGPLPAGPFGEVMKGAIDGGPASRGYSRKSPTNPGVVVHSWFVAP